MTRLLASIRMVLATGLALALGATLLAPPSAVAASQVEATATVNVRSAPSTSAKVVGSLRTGQVVPSNGTTKDWTKITYAGKTAYVASRYLAAVSSTPTGGSVVAGSVKATTGNVNLRKGPGVSYGVIVVLKTGTRVTAIGGVNGTFAEVYAGTRRGWVSTQYLKGASGLPAVIGTRLTTATLAIRTSADASAPSVGDLAKGTKVSITGASKNGRAQIVLRGAARWVTASYLAAGTTVAPPAANGVEKGLKPNAVKVYRAARKAYPQIKTYYGVRSGDGDHPTGRALDIMLPNYKSSSGRALGKSIAEWARRNAKTMGVHYVIWDQKIWNIQRDKEGWRPMANRGSDSANHKNHVHVSVN